MRTTLDIADDVLAAVRVLARRQRRTAGDVLSELARRALTGTDHRVGEPPAAYGFQPFPAEGRVVTDDQIDELRDREGL